MGGRGGEGVRKLALGWREEGGGRMEEEEGRGMDSMSGLVAGNQDKAQQTSSAQG